VTPEDGKLMIRAAKKGDVVEVMRLLALDPSLVEARDKDGCTPLHCASWKGNLDVVRAVLDAGADVAARNHNEHYGDTALHAAAHGNQPAVVELLIERGAKVNARNPAGRTPLGETEWHNARAAATVLENAGGVV
jgi:ankyrin repeat protein